MLSKSMLIIPTGLRPFSVPPKKTFQTRDLIEFDWFVPTASVMFISKAMPKPFPEWYFDIHQGDFALLLMLSTKGKLDYCDQLMKCV